MSNTGQIIAVDIGGTNARFCRARIGKGVPPELGQIRKYKVADHPSLADAWRQFMTDEGDGLPDKAAIALAAPTAHLPIKLTNSPWIVDPKGLMHDLGLRKVVLINDFEAIAHGITALPPERICHVFGKDTGLPMEGVITVLGPGTGLGVGIVARSGRGDQVLATEGGHMDFAPVDEIDDRLLIELRKRFGRVSVERVVSGPGLTHIHAALGAIEGKETTGIEDGILWQAALSGGDERASQALARLCMSYGSVAGDLALAHGAQCVVLAGSLTLRMRECPHFAKFHDRFVMKGRYRDYMAGIAVLYADHPEFGLFGAAAAGSALVGE